VGQGAAHEVGADGLGGQDEESHAADVPRRRGGHPRVARAHPGIPPDAMATSPLPVDVWADIACPWCYIGHHRLREVIADEPAGSVQVHPRAFELQPDLPPEGMSTEDFYPRKFGSAEAMLEAFQRVAAEAASSGLELRFDLMTRAPNTRLAHRLVALAARQGRAIEALDALFAGHFCEGADIADAEQAVALVADAAPELDEA